MNSENTLLDGLTAKALRQRVRTQTEEHLGCDLPSAACDELLLYLELVTSWGRRMDLVAPRDLDELLDLSLTDAAVLARFENECGRSGHSVVDVGSGGGAPGIPLAILLYHLRGAAKMTLVEPRTKRAAFLRTVAGRLSGEVPRVIRSRSDVLPAAEFDVALARATLPPQAWLEEGARLARRAVWVLLAREPLPSLSGYEVEVDHSYELSSTGAARRAVRFVPVD